MKNLKCCFRPAAQPAFPSAALLIMRLIGGIAFIFHGWGKIQNPFNWAGGHADIPAVFQFLAAVAEFGGGIAWILGLLMPLASFGLLCTMTVAVHMHMIVRKDPFVHMTGGPSYEPALVYWGIALLFLALGAGKFSLDAKLFGERGR